MGRKGLVSAVTPKGVNCGVKITSIDLIKARICLHCHLSSSTACSTHNYTAFISMSAVCPGRREGTVKTQMLDLIPLACFFLQWFLVLENSQTCYCPFSHHNPCISLITQHLRKHTPYSPDAFIWVKLCTIQSGYASTTIKHDMIGGDLNWSHSYTRPQHIHFTQLDPWAESPTTSASQGFLKRSWFTNLCYSSGTSLQEALCHPFVCLGDSTKILVHTPPTKGLSSCYCDTSMPAIQLLSEQDWTKYIARHHRKASLILKHGQQDGLSPMGQQRTWVTGDWPRWSGWRCRHSMWDLGEDLQHPPRKAACTWGGQQQHGNKAEWPSGGPSLSEQSGKERKANMLVSDHLWVYLERFLMKIMAAWICFQRLVCSVRYICLLYL